MPFKSKAQQRYMFAAESRGELEPGTARRWAHETKSIKKLPEYVEKNAAFTFGVLDELQKLAKQTHTWMDENLQCLQCKAQIGHEAERCPKCGYSGE